MAKDCPEGYADKETFKKIYAQFFPRGGTYPIWYALQAVVYCTLHDLSSHITTSASH